MFAFFQTITVLVYNAIQLDSKFSNPLTFVVKRWKPCSGEDVVCSFDVKQREPYGHEMLRTLILETVVLVPQA